MKSPVHLVVLLPNVALALRDKVQGSHFFTGDW